MKKILFFVMTLCLVLHFYSKGQDRQDEVRKKLQLNIDGESEILRRVAGWSQIENKEGKFWKQSDSTATTNYLPAYTNYQFVSLQMFKISIEGETFYCLKMILDVEGNYNLTFYENLKLQSLKKFIDIPKADNWDTPFDMLCCMTIDYRDMSDLNTILLNKGLIRALMLKEKPVLSSCTNDKTFFFINAPVVKSEAVIRFLILPLPHLNRDMAINNYFEVKKSDFEKLYTFKKYISPSAVLQEIENQKQIDLEAEKAKNKIVEQKNLAKPSSYKFETIFDNVLFEIPLNEEPSAISREIYSCPKNSVIYILDDTGETFYKAFVHGNIGYINKGFLKKKKLD